MNPETKMFEFTNETAIEGAEIGFQCDYKGQDLKICYGPGNRSWKLFIEKIKKEIEGQSSDTIASMQDDIGNKTMHFLEHCNVLDGDFNIIVAAGLTDEVKVCKYVENLRVITGHVRINNWPGETLGCLERLEYIGGKTITNAAYQDKYSEIALTIRQGSGLKRISTGERKFLVKILAIIFRSGLFIILFLNIDPL